MELPSVFPIFPLNEVLLVPGDLLPLHIFEPRYRDMVQDALDGNRVLAIAATVEAGGIGMPAVDTVVGLGRLLHRQLYPDGRSDIILEGIGRMEVLEEVDAGKPYRVVRAKPFADVSIAAERDLQEGALELCARLPGADEEQCRMLAKLPVARLLDSLLVRIPMSVEERHAIFAMAKLDDRLSALTCAMLKIDAPPAGMRFESGDPRLN